MTNMTGKVKQKVAALIADRQEASEQEKLAKKRKDEATSKIREYLGDETQDTGIDAPDSKSGVHCTWKWQADTVVQTRVSESRVREEMLKAGLDPGQVNRIINRSTDVTQYKVYKVIAVQEKDR